ncbi:[NiFe]-hydrogenase assembly chaperone HybE [Rhodopseudomonas palustris]|uniref:[NiFe]-hydrogenase assembly chaperone HybE n=1 Tax=Rhodopseudomonas palustris TaxID=1076 RepID=UPI000E5BE6CD|nr:[NiFe]-hydrogenase assembly chaperone HybE [Rhodopseudomonas palustris]QLH70154.1 [NiFe]-hydrogenase assembly chaperone HybE [Rhodopseudomonas palustris]RHZ97887.1 [NiFe]-hydrogenase assembly, chaperone, HybE [Rhodopseudomonas palustris]
MTAEVAAHRDVEALAAGEAVAAIYRAAVPAMRDLPVFNPALDVAAVGFRALDDHAFGVIVTPWFMNLVRLPLDSATAAGRSQGEVVTRVLPVGALEFTVGQLDGIGGIESCSLFSPMFDFADQSAVEAAAEAALAAVLEAEQVADETSPSQAPSKITTTLDRRGLLRGAWMERQP